jgi:hypothetical protein
MGITPLPGANSIAMYSNDCVSLHDQYTTEELASIQRGDLKLPLLAGCAYNAEAQMDGSKVFIVAVQGIGKHEEIFISYGR